MLIDCLVYIVDDDDVICLLVSFLLCINGYIVKVYVLGVVFFVEIGCDMCGCVFFDIWMFGIDGLVV